MSNILDINKMDNTFSAFWNAKSEHFYISHADLYSDDTFEFHISLVDWGASSFESTFKSNTGKHFYYLLEEFIKNYDTSKRITNYNYDNDSDGDRYLYIHVKKVTDVKEVKTFIDDLGKTLDQRYINEWSKHNVSKLKDLICQKFKDPSFAMFATYHYMSKHKDQDVLSTLQLIRNTKHF